MNMKKIMKRTIRSQLRCGNNIPWRGRLGDSRQATNRNLILGRQGGASGHNITKLRHSALQVNEALGRWRFSLLSGEVYSALRSARSEWGALPSVMEVVTG